MTNSQVPIRKKGWGQTLRTDNWRTEPILVLLGFLAFIAYASFGGYVGENYFWSAIAVPASTADHWAHFGGYLSPLYSPPLWIKECATCAPVWHAWIGPWPDWMPTNILIPASPAIFILIFPGAFRFTCYYYRKAYYRAFAFTPQACAVGAIPQKKFKGETGLLLFQNLHRFALYFAIIFIFILSYDAIQGFFMNGQFGIGVGSIVLLINPILLGSYTFGCHSFRHLVGGRMDCMSCSKARYGAWKKVSWLNERHQLFAWLSLFWVGFTDFYVRMVAAGVITDLNTWS